jgi:hypothetical protein
MARSKASVPWSFGERFIVLAAGSTPGFTQIRSIREVIATISTKYGEGCVMGAVVRALRLLQVM